MDIFGIGQSMIGATKILFQAARRTGRTTTLIESLKTGDTVVFTNSHEAKRVKTLCKERKVIINTVVVDPRESSKVYEMTYGNNGRTILDHSWIEQYYLEVFKQAQIYIDRLQRETSGCGTSCTETKMQLLEEIKWNF